METLQNEVDKLYEKHGATPNIIRLQIAINKLRNEYDKPESEDFLQ